MKPTPTVKRRVPTVSSGYWSKRCMDVIRSRLSNRNIGKTPNIWNSAVGDGLKFRGVTIGRELRMNPLEPDLDVYILLWSNWSGSRIKGEKVGRRPSNVHPVGGTSGHSYVLLRGYLYETNANTQ